MSTNEQFDDFFEGGGGEFAPSLKFKNGSGPGGNTEVGGGVIGTVLSMQKMDQTKMGSTEKILDKQGNPKQQMQIILQTDLRGWDKVAKVPTHADGDKKGQPLDPSEDDGRRAIYVKGWMTGAIGDAVLAATGRKGAPAIGGKLGVKVTELVPTDQGNPYAKYAAVYTPPTGGEGFFEPAQAASQAAATPAPAQPAPAADQPPF